MEAFLTHTGRAIPLDRVDVDTDQIIPAVFLKRIERTGFGPGLFHSWRHLPDGGLNPDFILNDPRYSDASVLISGRNFGCGSSREHAVWALMDYGFRAVICPSFAEIFHKNSMETGLIPVLVSDDEISELMRRTEATEGYQLTVDLEKCEVRDDQGLVVNFVVHPDPETHQFRRHCLLNGLDEIGLTLQNESKIRQFENLRGYK